MIELSNLLSHRQIRSTERAAPAHVTGARVTALGTALLAALGAVVLPFAAQPAQAAESAAQAAPMAATDRPSALALPIEGTTSQDGSDSGAVPRAVWDRLAMCESSGDWHIDSGNGFFGGLQFFQPTWRSFGGLDYAARADLATPREQIDIAEAVLRVQGWKAWPVCSQRAGVNSYHPHHRPRVDTVQPGDTLGSIAESHDIDGGWQQLYAINEKRIGPDPDLVTPGTVLHLTS